jgi:hypothetical protein
VELIVLNIGLEAGILDTRTFSMFVLHALVVTFMTTPLTIWFYPPKHRVHEGARVKDKPKDADEGAERKTSDDDVKTKFAFVLDRVEQLSSAMALTQLLQPPSAASSRTSINSVEEAKAKEAGVPVLSRLTVDQPLITIDVLRLIELTTRTSAVLKSQAAEALLQSDPIVSVFRTFGYLNHLPVSASLSVVPHNEFSTSIANHVRDSGSHMVIVPWTQAAPTEDGGEVTHNPFEGLFKQASEQTQPSAVVYSDFVRKVFLNAPCDVALFVDHGVFNSAKAFDAASLNQHLFLPFFGGPDDRLALSFVVQLCANPSVTATVIRMHKTEADLTQTNTSDDDVKGTIHHTVVSLHNVCAVLQVLCCLI